MSTPRGRRDSPADNQATEIPGQAASSNDAVPPAAHYNRLDISPQFHLTPQSPRHLLLHTQSTARENSGYDRRVRAASTTFPDKLFLVHGGASCHKQVSGVSPFRKGIAL
jgi:hypothetical protein